MYIHRYTHTATQRMFLFVSFGFWRRFFFLSSHLDCDHVLINFRIQPTYHWSFHFSVVHVITQKQLIISYNRHYIQWTCVYVRAWVRAWVRMYYDSTHFDRRSLGKSDKPCIIFIRPVFLVITYCCSRFFFSSFPFLSTLHIYALTHFLLVAYKEIKLLYARCIIIIFVCCVCTQSFN